jgi:hypothetical protein
MVPVGLREASRRADADQFVELDLYGGAAPVLGVLNLKDHQEGDNCHIGVDDELQRVGIMKNRPRQRPQGHNACGYQKCQRAAGRLGRTIGNLGEEMRCSIIVLVRLPLAVSLPTLQCRHPGLRSCRSIGHSGANVGTILEFQQRNFQASTSSRCDFQDFVGEIPSGPDIQHPDELRLRVALTGKSLKMRR